MYTTEDIKRRAGILTEAAGGEIGDLAKMYVEDPQGPQKVFAHLMGMQDQSKLISAIGNIVLALQYSDQQALRSFLAQTRKL